MSDAPRPEPPAFTKSVVRDYFESICIAVIFALFIRTFVFQAFKIPSKSMEDNLLVGDHLLVDKFGYAPRPAWLEGIFPYRAPQRGEVMVFKYPKDPQRDFIKRVVAVGGDRIEARAGQVRRNGKRIDEPYTVTKIPDEWDDRVPPEERQRVLEKLTRDQLRQAPMEVPPGEYFAMGDNRLNSEDSRAWGTVPASHVKGRALLIYWSFDVPKELQWIETEAAATPADRARLLRYTAWHFLTKSRWSRTFRVVLPVEAGEAP